MKVASWPDGNFYTLATRPAADGTLDVTGATEEATLPGGPEGFAYVSGDNVAFDADSLIVSEFSADVVSTFEIDANANPSIDTRREMLTGLNGAEGRRSATRAPRRSGWAAVRCSRTARARTSTWILECCTTTFRSAG